MSKMHPRAASRLRRKIRIRKKISGTAERPRLTIFRSSRHIYAQLVDDVTGATLASSSTKQAKVEGSGGNKDAAKEIGLSIAKAASEKGITNVVFDRNGYQYHGRVKALAEAAREGGLSF